MIDWDALDKRFERVGRPVASVIIFASGTVEVHFAGGGYVRGVTKLLAAGDFLRPSTADGQCIKMATSVMREQRNKGIEKYNSTLEDQQGYGLIGMTRMAQEEMADGSVYLAKLQMMLGQLRAHAEANDIEAIREMLK